MEWTSRRTDAALEVILRASGSQGIGSIAILRAKRSLEESWERTPEHCWKERESWIKLRGLLELLTATTISAMDFFDAKLCVLENGSLLHESLTVAILVMLYTYAVTLRNVVPPALLRERAEQALDEYPNNTIILAVFLEAQKGQGIWGRVKALFGEHAGVGMKEKDVSRRIAEVWIAAWEKGRWEAEQERTRSGLSMAVSEERTRGSAILWRIYLEFEVRCGKLRQAKKLLFRAVSECPLVKELYLVAFGPLRSEFSGRELNDWAETMVERGIRMRRGLDEALEGWIDPDEPTIKDREDAGEMDIEHNAEELRRLRPY